MKVRMILHRTAAVAGFAALLTLTGACAHHTSTTSNDSYGHVATSEPASSAAVNGTTPVPGPATVDSSGNIYTSSAAPGTGNASGVGTNTNVNNVPQKGTSSVTYTESTNLTPAVAEVTPAVTESTTTTTTETTPMISSSSDQTTTTTTETAKTTTHRHHRRMRKD